MMFKIIVWFFLDLLCKVVSERVVLLNTTRDGWKDWKKNTEKYQGWRIQNLPPNGDEVYGVCDVNQASSNSWLRSPFIPREKGIILHVKLYFTMRECKSYPDPRMFVNCEEVFHLLKYEADGETEDIQYNEKYFVNVQTISSNVKWEDKDRTENILNVQEASMSITRSGVIIAFRNTGSCVMIKDVVVYYSRCPMFVSNFVVFPQASAVSGTSGRNIEGNCVDGAVKAPSSEQMLNFCQSNGIWSKSIFYNLCECNLGHEGNKNRTKCIKCKINFFKSSSGNKGCLPCEENSYSPMGSIRCYCNAGFYEIPSKSTTLLCKRPPQKPRNLRIDASDQARIILTWDPLELEQTPDSDTNNTLKYAIVCVNCPNKLDIIPSPNITGNKVVVHGVLPSREYNFKVTTQNYVTQYVTNAFDIEQSISRASVLTSPLENIEKIVIDKVERIDNSIYIKWIKIKSSTEVVAYECVLLGYKGIISSSNIKNPDLAKYTFGLITEHTFKELDVYIAHYLVKVRWRNNKGWGQYTETNTIDVKKNSDIKNNVIVSKSSEKPPNSSTKLDIDATFNNPRKDVILVILGAILLMVILIVIVILASYCIRRQMLYNAYRMKIKKNKFDVTHPAQLIYSSAYSLPIQSYAKYHDPSTYEDISIALQDFTKEVDPSWVSTDALIGEGEFGNVFCGTMKFPRGEEKVVAIKILKASASVKEKNNFLVEASTMGQFIHDNIVRLQGVVSITEPYMIITDYMVNGALLNFLINNKDNLTIIQQLKMLSNVAAGMRYLCSMGFIHRDLAARNILLDDDFSCKIADFGLSRQLACDDDLEKIYQNKNEIKIPIKWTAPEAILYHKFTHAGDVWSFGVLAWEILSYGDKPYWQWSNQEVIEAIQSGYRLPPPVNCPPIIHNLMLHCWNNKVEQRPTFTQLYFEVEQFILRLNSDIELSERESRREYKSCEKAHLLRHCNEIHLDMNEDIIAPQPPPRNVIFDSHNTKSKSTPDAIGFSLTLTRQSSNCCNSGIDLKIKEPVMTLTKMNPSVIPLHPYMPANIYYQPCISQPNHEYRSYGTDPIVPNQPDNPSNKVIQNISNGSLMSLEEFLFSINIPQYITLLKHNGIHSINHLCQIKYDQLKSLGIISKEDRKNIIKCLKPLVYC